MVRCTVACSRTHPVTTVAGCGCCVALALHIRVARCSGMGRGPDGPLHAFLRASSYIPKCYIDTRDAYVCV